MDPVLTFYLGAILGVTVGFILAGAISTNCNHDVVSDNPTNPSV